MTKDYNQLPQQDNKLFTLCAYTDSPNCNWVRILSTCSVQWQSLKRSEKEWHPRLGCVCVCDTCVFYLISPTKIQALLIFLDRESPTRPCPGLVDCNGRAASAEEPTSVCRCGRPNTQPLPLCLSVDWHLPPTSPQLLPGTHCPFSAPHSFLLTTGILSQRILNFFIEWVETCKDWGVQGFIHSLLLSLGFTVDFHAVSAVMMAEEPDFCASYSYATSPFLFLPFLLLFLPPPTHFQYSPGDALSLQFWDS